MLLRRLLCCVCVAYSVLFCVLLWPDLTKRDMLFRTFICVIGLVYSILFCSLLCPKI